MVRGNNRCDLFTCDIERYHYLRCLQHALSTVPCQLHAFVLMTNHVHLLATGNVKGAISEMLHDVGCRFARFVNNRRHRTGTLFEGRFKSSLVQTDRYFLTCMRYIEMNPVRAGMVMRVADYSWSSFVANGSGEPISPLTPHPTYLALGTAASHRGNAYRRLFDHPISEEDLAAIRQSLRESRVLGGLEFERRISQEMGFCVAPATHGGKRIKGTGLNLTP